MRWQGERQSDNLEDRRGMRPSAAVGGGLGIGTIVIALVVMFLGGDPQAVLQSQGGRGGAVTQQSGLVQSTPAEEERIQFVRVVLASTEDVWQKEFSRFGREYQEPKLVTFREAVQSGCGYASSQMGPFYCGADKTIYLDLEFFEQLKTQFGASGEFAQAYVIAHEVGHHVQNLLGTSGQVHEKQQQVDKTTANQLSVRLELQADFYAGLWARKADESRDLIDPADIRDGLEAAQAIGDDTLQEAAQGHIVPDSFTHGSSEQRMRWFKKGWDTGDIRQGDTFSVRNL